MPDARWILAEHRGPEGLAALEADWRALFASMPDPAPWHSHEAFTAYLGHLCPAPADFRCFALSDGERVRAILPIEERIDRSFVESGFGAPVRVWGMPFREGWSITDAIGPEDDARETLLPAVIEHLRMQEDRPAVLVLGRSRCASVLWDGLATGVRGARFVFDDGNEYVVPTDLSVDAFNAGLSKQSRRKIKRARRAHEDLPFAEYESAAAPGDVPGAYATFIALEASGWKGAHGSAIRQREGLEDFYRDLTGRLRLDGRFEVHSLRAQGVCIASLICVYVGRSCAVLKIAYDEAYSRVSPGQLLNHESLERCCADPGVDVATFIADAPWLDFWRPEANHTVRAYVSLRPVSGPLLVAAFRIRYGLVRRVVRAVKAWRREHDDRTQARRGRDAE